MAFDDGFNYLYGIVTTGGACVIFYQSFIYTRLGLVLPHVHTGKVMEVIVGLLKDRVEVDDSPDSKRARKKKYIKE